MPIVRIGRNQSPGPHSLPGQGRPQLTTQHPMGPTSPFEYHPTPHLIGLILFVVFPLIYLTGRLAFGTVSLAFCVLRFMLASACDFLYSDEDELDFERSERPAVAETSKHEVVEDTNEESDDHESEAEDVVSNNVHLTNGLTSNGATKDGQPSSEEDSVDSGMGIMQSGSFSNGIGANSVAVGSGGAQTSPTKKHRRWSKKHRP
ncbi:hypothetical protein L596_007648 [Steinernema carpocapsae]|uniref:Uncharacterized protein n=1 Tax=Steinernema carpocapsae TaxID=34508 RepID=A0A4U5P9Z8_STECR|nr:hypothetical protein L596_007648 [Steinernema carpocapsae]